MVNHYSVQPNSDNTYSIQTRKGTKRSKAPLIVVLVLVLLIAAAGAFAAFALHGSYQRVRGYAAEATGAANGFTDAIKSMDPEALEDAVVSLSSEIESIRAEMQSPLWQVISMVPMFTEDVNAANDFLDLAEGLIDDVANPVIATLKQYPIDQIHSDGDLNPDAIRAYCAVATSITPAVQQAAAKVKTINSPHVGQINDAVAKISEPLEDVSAKLTKYGDVIRLAPDILGCNGMRTYLLAAQNPSEIRSTGGMPGAMVPIFVDNGSIIVGEIVGGGAFEAEYEPVIPLTDEEYALFGEHVGEHITNCNFIPDFPRVCELWEAFCYKDFGITFDGVIAIDPVVLQYIIGVVGDVDMGDGVILNGENTAAFLLYEVYMMFPDNASMDSYFAEAATQAFERFKAYNFGSLENLKRLKKAIERSIDSGRLLIHMSNPDEQQLMRHFKCSGELYQDPAVPTLGIYFDDNTSSKIDWWLYSDTVIGSPTINPDGTTSYPVTTSVTNAATWEEINAAPRYITGGSTDKYSTGDMITVVYILAPAGGYISDMYCDNGEEVGEFWYEGHHTFGQRMHNEPGETWTFYYTVTVSADATKPLALHTTPVSW